MTRRGLSPGEPGGPLDRWVGVARGFVLRKFRDLAGIDERTLAALRVGLAALVLADLVGRMPDLVAHYSDSGVLPRSALTGARLPSAAPFLLYFLSGSALWPAVLLTLTAATAGLLLVGWRTTWTTATTWYLVSCLHARTPLMTHGGDELLRVLLLWAIVLPLGRAASLDDRRHPASGQRQVVTVATLGVQMHLTALFIGESWTNLDAAAAIGALHLDHLATSWGLALREVDALMRYAGLTIGGLGLVGPLLLWFPQWTAQIRFFVVLAFWQLHLLLISPALELGLQPWVASLAWLVFVPGWFWSFFTEGRLGLEGGSARFRRAAGDRVRAAAAAILVLLATLQLLPRPAATALGAGLRSATSSAGRALGLARPSLLLLPDPDAIDGWFLMRGRLENGSDWDVWNQVPATLSKPPLPSRTYRNSRWRSYFTHLVAVDAAAFRHAFSAFSCRSWNRRHDGPLRAVEIEIVFMLERYDTRSRESRHLPVALGSHECPAGDG